MELPLNLGICLTGTGSFVPATYLDNQQISQMMVTSDEWITTRTGICRRHLLPHRHLLTDMATGAAQRAIAMAGLTPQQLDLIILALYWSRDISTSNNT